MSISRVERVADPNGLKTFIDGRRKEGEIHLKDHTESMLEQAYNFVVYDIIEVLLITPLELKEILMDCSTKICKSNFYLKGYSILKRAVFLALAAYFFRNYYLSFTFSSNFVSLDKNAGNCNEVPKTWTLPSLNLDFYGSATNPFLASSNGMTTLLCHRHWAGQAAYKPSHASYIFNIFDFSSDRATYSAWMSKFDTQLKALGTISASQNLGRNLLYWHSWYTLNAIEVASQDGKSIPINQSMILSGDTTLVKLKFGFGLTTFPFFAFCSRREIHHGQRHHTRHNFECAR